MKIITLQRQWYTHDTTIGQLFIDGKPFCYTLEDTCRAWNIKVPKHTAIPATGDTFYKIDVTYSNRFKKDLPIIYTRIDKDGNYILENGISFTAIRFHAGNNSNQSEGCPLVAFNFDGVDKIYGSADDALTAIIKEYLKTDTVGLNVVNLPNKFTQ